MGFSHVLRLCLQGGGVFVQGGTVTFLSCTITGNTATWVCAHARNFPSPPWKFPIAPMGDSRFARCLQGGGVSVGAGTVTISSCTISGNTAGSVSAHAQKFPSHAHTLALILACATANASVNYSGCVPQRSCEVPIAPMGDSCFARLNRAAVSWSMAPPSQ
jgi:hypothetical protein